MICESFPEGSFYIACKVKSSSERLEGKAVNNLKLLQNKHLKRWGRLVNLHPKRLS